MVGEGENHSSTSLMVRLLHLILGHPIPLLNLLFDLLQHIPLMKSLPGMYEVLDYEAQLELKDDKGHIAIYSKHQKVRFLQDNVIAYQDKAFGDGEIFASYKCSPGVEVDRYQEGHRFNILISLRETRNRDEKMTFHIERKIRDGFTKNVEEFVTDISHRTRRLSLNLVFPKNRLPKQVSLIELNSRRTKPLGTEHQQTLPDGRQRYTWEQASPRLFESYILRWEW